LEIGPMWASAPTVNAINNDLLLQAKIGGALRLRLKWPLACYEKSITKIMGPPQERNVIKLSVSS
ncbi:MAG: hypothetical protein IJY91_06175, partial [Oscillospiraceae bacterium]|nr:hypothetical protein [Oscillospiraceae bacterium]